VQCPTKLQLAKSAMILAILVARVIRDIVHKKSVIKELSRNPQELDVVKSVSLYVNELRYPSPK
jgi:hypothetical protein